ncbi:MAG: P1 family peptidase, partial [Chitinophagaceae bacterium]|nr:P1 family peptidase [Chitinophagaceae bacterium]
VAIAKIPFDEKEVNRRVVITAKEMLLCFPDMGENHVYEEMSPLFMAVIEATEEAIINSLFAAESMQGFEGHTVKAWNPQAGANIVENKHELWPVPQREIDINQNLLPNNPGY